jgi:hypothetical protein
MTRRISLIPIVLFATLFAVTACSSNDRSCVNCADPDTVAAKPDPSTEFERSLALWKSKRPAKYEMTVAATTSAIMATRVVVSVEGETAKSIQRADPRDIDRTEPYKRYDTVEKLFDLVKANQKLGPERFSVTYDPDLGYPKSIKADPISNAVDDEYSINVDSLEPG